MNIFIIKPLDEDYKVVEFRTTRVEGEIIEYKVQHGLASPQFTQNDPYLMEQIMAYGTCVHDIFLPACLSGESAGREQTNKYLPIIEQMISEISVKYEDRIKAKKPPSILNQLEYLKRVTLPRGDFIKLSKDFPATAIEMEIPLEIHAGKYKIKIITKIDHVYGEGREMGYIHNGEGRHKGFTGAITHKLHNFLGKEIILSDLKSAAKLWEDNPLEEYNVNNIEGTSLENKLQLVIYSLAAMLHFETEEIVFRYIVFEKHDTKKKEKPFNHQVINFRITKAEAEEKVKEIMIFYFKNVFNYDKYMIGVSERDTIIDGDV